MGNPICHFEIGCRDSAALGKFYGSLFDWEIKPDGPATWIKTGSDIGGHINSLGHEPHNYLTVYVKVDDLQATIDRAVELGGKMLVPPVSMPHGSFAWIADPEGTIVGIYKE